MQRGVSAANNIFPLGKTVSLSLEGMQPMALQGHMDTIRTKSIK